MEELRLFDVIAPVESASVTVYQRPDGWEMGIAIRREGEVRWDDRAHYESLTLSELVDVLVAVLST